MITMVKMAKQMACLIRKLRYFLSLWDIYYKRQDNVSRVVYYATYSEREYKTRSYFRQLVFMIAK